MTDQDSNLSSSADSNNAATDSSLQGANSSSAGPLPSAGPKKMGYVAAAKKMYSDPQSRKYMLILTGVGVFALGFGLFRLLSGPPPAHVANDQVQTAAVHGAPGGSKGSRQYYQDLAAANHALGAKAAKAGHDYIPTPGKLHPTKKKVVKKAKTLKKPVHPKKTVVIRNQYAPATTSHSAATASNKAMSAKMAAMEKELQHFDANTPYQAVSVTSISRMPKVTSVALSHTNQMAAARSRVLAHPGYLAYAMLDSAVNSNIPGPILATIESGKFKGARLLGSFRRVKQRDLLQFGEMTWDGHSYPITAYAVSPQNMETALATSVNDHTLYRYGWLFAGAFLQGIDEALSDADSTVTAGNGYALVTHQLNNGQILEQAAGNVGNVITPIMEQRFDTPPTVRVAAGTGMGILFMDAVKEKTHATN